jgi:hypothetical protein
MNNKFDIHTIPIVYTILSNFPKEILIEIFDFAYNTCINCKKYLLVEYVCYCGKKDVHIIIYLIPNIH